MGFSQHILNVLTQVLIHPLSGKLSMTPMKGCLSSRKEWGKNEDILIYWNCVCVCCFIHSPVLKVVPKSSGTEEEISYRACSIESPLSHGNIENAGFSK